MPKTESTVGLDIPYLQKFYMHLQINLFLWYNITAIYVNCSFPWKKHLDFAQQQDFPQWLSLSQRLNVCIMPDS